jgi:hypothetical protein
MSITTMQAAAIRLTRTIERHLAGLVAPDEDIQGPLQHMRASARDAEPHGSLSLESAPDYEPLLRRALQGGMQEDTREIVAALAALPNRLAWNYHYEPRPADENLARHIAFAELIGPEGPLAAPACRLGFTLMAENTDYPLHAHPAVELYLVIAGHAEWRTPGSAVIQAPGRLVLHASNQPHAMRTSAQPLLAVWCWSGDLETPAFYI